MFFRYIALIVLFVLIVDTSSAQNLDHFTDCTDRTIGNATLIVPGHASVTVGNTEPQESDEMAIFNEEGTCIGAARWQNRSFAITIWEEDEHLNVDGAKSGEAFHVRIWRSAENREYSVEWPSSSFVLSDEEPYLSDQARYQRNAIYLLDSLSIAVNS